jgi:hypothetical protein
VELLEVSREPHDLNNTDTVTISGIEGDRPLYLAIRMLVALTRDGELEVRNDLLGQRYRQGHGDGY